MSSKYVDIAAIVQVIGNVYNYPQLLDLTDKYTINEEDFDNLFHKIVFGSIFKLYDLGSSKITIKNILDFLSTRPEYEAVFKSNKVEEWLLKASENASYTSFDYYYNRMKKMTLLRMYDKYGVDVSFLYDPDNILDIKKKQLQEEWLDNSSLEDIANKIDERIESIKLNYVNSNGNQASQAGESIDELIQGFKDRPEVGVPLFGPYINTVTRGARRKKFYLRSAPTGVGKSRSLIADACNIACNKIYDPDLGLWKSNGASHPTLYIATEQELSEVQTMMLAFLSCVNEEHILNGRYEGNEEDRVITAAQILKESPLYIETLPDFSIQDIENTIKRNIRDHNIFYVFHDYIHTSMKILEEVTRRSGGVRLREDNILFMLSIKLKDICNINDVFIFSATQLNGDYVDSDTPDQNLLRGAKAIADKIDMGSILLPVSTKDIDGLVSILDKNVYDKPNLKLSIYKNRRGRYKGIYLWCKADLGTCRITPMFATDYAYNYIDIQDTKIIDEESAC